MTAKKTVDQIKPLHNAVAPIWEHDTSDYPDVVKVAMADGHVITYQRVIEQPHPNCLKAIDLIKIMKGHTYGGSYKGKHVRKDQMTLFTGGEKP